MIITVTLHAFMYAETINALDKLIDYGFPAILVSSMLCTLKYRREIHNLSRDVDSWGTFRYLEKETEDVRMNAKLLAQRFSRFYMFTIIMGTGAYCLAPLGKFLFLEPSDPADLLIFPCWTPLPIDTNWGFYTTYFCQSVIIICANIAFSRVFCYKIICFYTIGQQMRLIGSALSTIEQRAERQMREKKNLIVKGKTNIHFIMEQEIKQCARQYQTAYRAVKDTTSIFRPVTSVVYHYGMWVICATGVKIAIEEQLFMKVQILMLLNVILVNQYLYSVSSENLKNEVELLRIVTYSCPWYKMPIHCQKSILLMITSMSHIPSFNTIFGTETNMENFGKILNGSYYYISLLLTILSD
ncbi:uncharacterized protein [Halyomorpha halys]|uniref:uncharacterized protein n=1 Tax=Halyomorpha halys TaxID=286706 RepID=UPI0006D50FF2